MTIAEYFEDKGLKAGLKQSTQETLNEIAAKLVLEGVDHDIIKRVTGFDLHSDLVKN